MDHAVRFQPNRNYKSNDDVQTPVELAAALVAELNPTGVVMEPCAGEGAFLRALPTGALWCEVKSGRDFLIWQGKVDWIVTNPPWRQIRGFLRKSFEVADRVAFLMTINHAWTRARLRDAKAAGFALRKIVLVETPASFPQSGFQLGMVVYERGWNGAVEMKELPGRWC